MSQNKSKGKSGKPGKSGAGKDAAPKARSRKHQPDEAVQVRWEKKNVVLLGVGIGSVLLGYMLLSQGDITAAPLLLVAGYCVLIPLAFIL
ncbi:MAG: hypothetical protein HKN12_01305 [Gemmatimonadetes bacterium]|nr:hypothetical protein [Gemmatimonadota bacterium]